MDEANATNGKELLAQAEKLHLEKKFPEAERLYDLLLAQNPDMPWLLAQIGTLYLQQEKFGLSIALLKKAADQKPEGDILCNLALAYKYSGQRDKAMSYFDKAIKKDPSPETLCTYAGMHVNVAEPEKAVKYADLALRKNPDHAMAHWNKSMALLEMGDWANGWDEMEAGFASNTRIKRDIAGAPYWDGTKGKTIAVYGEQGIGDEIMFASMLPDLMAKNSVILECHPRLEALFKRAFPNIQIYGTRTDKAITWPQNHQIDYAMSIGSLGKWFRRSDESFPGTPYLKADALPKGGKFRVGISWTGGRKPGRVAVRSIPLSWWGPILDVPEVEFVSLQYTECEADLAVMKAEGYNIKVMDEYVKAQDYYETARLVASCDLVISIATSVYHLAGALGVPAWVMAPNKPAWREQVKGRMPFYRSVRMYRQPQGDKSAWVPVLERVGFDLRELIFSQQRIAA